jgi:glycosyltransferase involved in cell wall biosynthesis
MDRKPSGVEKMRIAQVAPLIESVPPRLYGGTERIVSYLTEELVRLGHDVTLFASGDLVTAAELVPCVPVALRLNHAVRDPIPYFMLMMAQVAERTDEFDVIHFHIDQFQFPIFNEMARRTMTTLHGRQDLPDLHHLYRGFPDMPLVSISNSQRLPIPDANFVATIYHGLPRDLMPTPNPRGGYLAFLGRISEKRVDRRSDRARTRPAAQITARSITDGNLRAEIEPLLAEPGIEYIGEIDERRKVKFLGEARALLFPIDWPEPFGLAMIEAMACGTPVLAFRKGAVPEVIDEGVTGYVVDSSD